MNFDYILQCREDLHFKLRQSFDGGKTWERLPFYNELHEIIRQEVNRYIVEELIAPELSSNEILCHACAADAKVGIAIAHIEHGTEKQTVVRYIGDCECTYDEDFGVTYQVWRCERCGAIADSDYV